MGRQCFRGPTCRPKRWQEFCLRQRLKVTVFEAELPAKNTRLDREYGAVAYESVVRVAAGDEHWRTRADEDFAPFEMGQRKRVQAFYAKPDRLAVGQASGLGPDPDSTAQIAQVALTQRF